MQFLCIYGLLNSAESGVIGLIINLASLGFSIWSVCIAIRIFHKQEWEREIDKESHKDSNNLKRDYINIKKAVKNSLNKPYDIDITKDIRNSVNNAISTLHIITIEYDNNNYHTYVHLAAATILWTRKIDKELNKIIDDKYINYMIRIDVKNYYHDWKIARKKTHIYP